MTQSIERRPDLSPFRFVSEAGQQSSEEIIQLINEVIRCGKEAIEIAEFKYDRRIFYPLDSLDFQTEPCLNNARECAVAISQLFHAMSLSPRGTRIATVKGIEHENFDDDPVFTKEMFTAPITRFERTIWEEQSRVLQNPQEASFIEAIAVISLLRERRQYFSKVAYGGEHYGTETGLLNLYGMAAYQRAEDYVYHVVSNRIPGSQIDFNYTLSKSNISVRTP